MVTLSRSSRLACLVFRALLRLYPAHIREEYGREMTLVFADRIRDEERRFTRSLVVLSAWLDVLVDAPRQHASVLGQDLRHAVRGLSRERAFGALGAGTIALGIGLASAVFSIDKALVVDPPPYPESNRAVMVWVNNPRQGIDRDYTSYPRVLDWRAHSRLIESFAVFALRQAVVTGAGEAEQIHAARVSPNFFDVVRTTPLAGRLFARGEEQANVVILSQAFWQRRFGADPGVIGHTVHLDSAPYTVIGVLPPRYQFPERDLEVWVPLQPDASERAERGWFWLQSVARLAAGVTPAQAEQEMNAIARRLASQYTSDRDLGITLVGLHEHLSGPFRSAMLLLTGAVVGVLLIACANVAGMLTARGAARKREVAIRTALGASTRRVLRQLLTEALALFLAGGVMGLAIAWLAVRLLVAGAPPALSRLQDVALEPSIVVLSLGLALVTGVIFGILPSWHATRADIADALGFGTRGLTRAVVSPRFRRALLIAQIAIATLVLSASGVLLRSLIHMQRVDLGFEPRGVLTARLDLPDRKYPDGAARVRFVDRLLERLEADPGVTSAAMASSVLLGALPVSTSFTPEGRSEIVEHPLTYDSVTPEFFSLLQIPLRRGRFFSSADHAGSTPVAIINETTARAYWPTTDPVGKRFKLGSPDSDGTWLTIVGVVADTRRAGVDHSGFTESYLPYRQNPRGALLLIRTTREPTSLVPTVRGAVRELDTDQPVARVATLEQLLGARIAPRRFNTWLLNVFGVVAVVLTGIGLYSLVAYVVLLRKHEMAVRLAVGATPGKVLGLVMRDVSILVGLGIAAGVAGFSGIAPWLRTLLVEIRPADPVSESVVIGLLAGVAFLAAWIPARRAMRVDLARTLCGQ